jgi:hypothetical protein
LRINKLSVIIADISIIAIIASLIVSRVGYDDVCFIILVVTGIVIFCYWMILSVLGISLSEHENKN